MPLRPSARPGHPYLAGAPLLVAHRGGAGLAPENTFEAFRQAVEVFGADMLELDVRLSADGKVVVIHDATVDRTTDGSGRVAEMPWRELQALDAGHRFQGPDGDAGFRGRDVRLPLLDDVLDGLPWARLNVEAKCREVAGPLVERIRAHSAEHRVLVAAEHESHRIAARGYPGPWGASRSQIVPFLLLHRAPFGSVYTPRVDALQVPERWRGRRLVTRRFVHEAHRRNIPVHVWTVDDPSDMRRLLELGVDGIQTDRPDRLARVLHDECGRPLPPALEAA
ncbi:MAG TPA: glycerophosphodiester phosphodiesterase [Longimicrobiales bacterium]|nr:glycerophosphodiester phosphodiesterase [Longimicrobiales bacterium]